MPPNISGQLLLLMDVGTRIALVAGLGMFVIGAVLIQSTLSEVTVNIGLALVLASALARWTIRRAIRKF